MQNDADVICVPFLVPWLIYTDRSEAIVGTDETACAIFRVSLTWRIDDRRLLYMKLKLTHEISCVCVCVCVGGGGGI